MNSKVFLSPKAMEEITDAYNWYEEQSKGAGISFINAVDSKIKQIADHPEAFAVRRK